MKNFRRLLKKARPYWWLLVITCISLICVTAFNLVTPWMIRDLVDILSKDHDSTTIVKVKNIAFILVLVYVARAVF
ncbi:MAG: ABC transporter ATP-binding protein, partial [Clostridiaceae bacterium]|nr:ABC transporter ATP-binding protein [Clostridiaceae bacterium]